MQYVKTEVSYIQKEKKRSTLTNWKSSIKICCQHLSKFTPHCHREGEGLQLYYQYRPIQESCFHDPVLIHIIKPASGLDCFLPLLNSRYSFYICIVKDTMYSSATTRIYICRLLLLCKHNTTTYIMEYRSDLGLGIIRYYQRRHQVPILT